MGAAWNMDNMNFDFCFKCNWHAGETHPGQKFKSIPEGAEEGRKPVRALEGGENKRSEKKESEQEDGEQPGSKKGDSEQEGSEASDGVSGEERADEER